MCRVFVGRLALLHVWRQALADGGIAVEAPPVYFKVPGKRDYHTTKTCESCGGVFLVRRQKYQVRRFCAGCSKKIKGNGTRTKRGTWNDCPVCRTPFYVYPSERRTYCSPKCGYEAKTAYPWIVTECQFCGREFNAKDKPHSNNANTYCSRACRDLAYRELKGSANPNWQGGKSAEHTRIRQTAEYAEWRSAVFARDNYSCQECGQHGGKLHAHHIEAFADNPERRTDLANGVSLCRDCHGKKHGIRFNGD